MSRGGPYGFPNGYSESSKKWFAKTWGVASQGWICPDARQMPVVKNATPWWGEVLGSRNSAWQVNDVTVPGWLWGGEPTGDYATIRAGSYAGNSWLTHWGWWWGGLDPGHPEWVWTKDTQIMRPANTAQLCRWHFLLGGLPKGNRCSEVPGLNTGGGTGEWGMDMLTIPRHGSHPSSFPNYQPPQIRLPGSINMSFYDGHAAPVEHGELMAAGVASGLENARPAPGFVMA